MINFYWHHAIQTWVHICSFYMYKKTGVYTIVCRVVIWCCLWKHTHTDSTQCTAHNAHTHRFTEKGTKAPRPRLHAPTTHKTHTQPPTQPSQKKRKGRITPCLIIPYWRSIWFLCDWGHHHIRNLFSRIPQEGNSFFPGLSLLWRAQAWLKPESMPASAG